MNSPLDVVVTGVGLCTRLGHDLDAHAAALRTGTSPPFTVWDAAVAAGCGCHLFGGYPHDLSDATLAVSRSQGRFMGRASRLALVAAREALRQSGVDGDDLAVIFASGTGDVDTHAQIRDALRDGSATRVGPTVIPRLMGSTVSANLATVLGATGPSASVAAACAGGAYNLVLGAMLVAGGQARAALVGGAEAVDLHFHAGFDRMRAYNRSDNEHPERASRPYAADRAGFIFGEGAGALVVETRASAVARGAPILGAVLGFGMSSNGDGQMVSPSEAGAITAMRKGLLHAGISAADVDYVNTHATSTPSGDVVEALAVRAVLDGRPVPYSSTKGYTGHTITAAGAIEAIFTLMMLRGGWIAPCVHAEPLDPELAAWPPVTAPVDRALRVALSNAFGFGGTNVSLVLGRE